MMKWVVSTARHSACAAAGASISSAGSRRKISFVTRSSPFPHTKQRLSRFGPAWEVDRSEGGGVLAHGSGDRLPGLCAGQPLLELVDQRERAILAAPAMRIVGDGAEIIDGLRQLAFIGQLA